MPSPPTLGFALLGEPFIVFFREVGGPLHFYFFIGSASAKPFFCPVRAKKRLFSGGVAQGGAGGRPQLHGLSLQTTSGVVVLTAQHQVLLYLDLVVEGQTAFATLKRLGARVHSLSPACPLGQVKLSRLHFWVLAALKRQQGSGEIELSRSSSAPNRFPQTI